MADIVSPCGNWQMTPFADRFVPISALFGYPVEGLNALSIGGELPRDFYFSLCLFMASESSYTDVYLAAFSILYRRPDISAIVSGEDYHDR